MPSLRAVRSAFAVATACAVISMPVLAQTASPRQAAAKAPAASQQSQSGGERIAAVVNDEVISNSDVSARIKLALLNAGAQGNQEALQRLVPQVLRQLVDERLQLQEAKRNGITIAPAEVEDAIKRIAEQNRMNRPQLESMLKAQGVPLTALSDQLRALLAWQRVMQRRLRQEVTITDEDIDAAMERLKANIGKPEYLVAEIFLAVDSPDQDAEVRRTADRLVEEVRRGGNFAAIARQFSQSAGAASGGDLGWVRTGELSPEVDRALAGTRSGQLTAPVRSATGYHILLVRGQRAYGSGGGEEAPPPPPPRPRVQPKPDIEKAKVNMKQIILPVHSPSPTKEDLAQLKASAEALRKSIKSCADFDEKAKATGVPESGDMGTLRVKDLPQGLQQMAVGIPLGRPSPVLMSQAAAVILIVCKRDLPMIAPPPEAEPVAAPPPPPAPAKEAKLPARDEVERDLINERADLLARRYLRDLRRAAFIEVRS